jgi:hypothetical protein
VMITDGGHPGPICPSPPPAAAHPRGQKETATANSARGRGFPESCDCKLLALSVQQKLQTIVN